MLSKLIFKFLASHYKKPVGLLGKYVGRKMDTLNDKQNDWVLSLLDLQPTDHILEIGYGTGKTLKKVLERVTKGQITGIDVSSTMYQVASKLLKGEIAAGHVTLHQGSVENLPFPDSSFSKVFAVHVVYFLPDLKKVFSEIYRVSIEAGLVAISFVSPIIAPSSVFHQYSLEEVEKALVDVGFSKIVVKIRPVGQQNGICILATK